MKVIGSDSNDKTVIVRMSVEEWHTLELASGVPYEKRSTAAGASVEMKFIRNAVDALREIKAVRKDMGAV